MNKSYLGLLAAALIGAAPAAYADDVLTGDVRLACEAYFDHGWTTAGDKVRYVGEEKQGGRWVDVH